MSQGTAPARPHHRAARAVLAALTLPAVLALAGCGDTANVAAPALASAGGPATDSAAVHAAVCSRVEAAWAAFLPSAGYVVVTKTAAGHPYQVYQLDYHAYGQVSRGLFDSLTGNREYRLTRDIDVLAAAAGDVYGDPGQSLSPEKDLAAVGQAAPVVAKDCGTTLSFPA